MNMYCLICKKPVVGGTKRLCKEHASPKGLFKSIDLLKSEDLSAKSPNIFIGTYGYPYVNVGILSTPERKDDAWLYDDAHFWAEENFNKENVMSLRTSLINARFQASIKEKKNRFLDVAKEIGMAKKPVDVDVILEKKPQFRVDMNAITMPHGPNAQLRSAKLAENPSILTKVDKIVSDTDLKSTEGLKILYQKGIDEHALIKLLSVGNLGIKIQRKLVPTKWSITAVHNQLGKHIIKEVRDYNRTDYTYYFGGYMHNYFLVLFFPDIWAFELFETYVPKTPVGSLDYTTDYEFFKGRKKYAQNCVGGYYSCRLAVLEKLKILHKQGTVLVLRFTTPEYDVSLGVWVVLEATKKALETKALRFDSSKVMLHEARNLIKEKFNIDINQFLKKSKILEQMKTQTKLSHFL